MRIFFTIITVLFCSNPSAQIYKCSKNNKTSYQQVPCVESGSVGHKFTLQDDITVEQQVDAKVRMNSDLAVYNETKKLNKEVNDKERLIKAEENKASAAFDSADQAKRQANALEERNKIERKGLRSIYVQIDTPTPYSRKYPSSSTRKKQNNKPSLTNRDGN